MEAQSLKINTNYFVHYALLPIFLGAFVFHLVTSEID